MLGRGEDDIVEAVFEMGETRARQLMVPRTEIMAFRVDTPLDEVIDQAAESALTKFPVYEATSTRRSASCTSRTCCAPCGAGR